jgi:LmbE family N-acetylglucosaminyl deacetylase
LQPHFDDAALSCGGTIRLQTATGQNVLIVTVFGGAPADGAALSAFAQQQQQRMGLGRAAAEAVRRRREEDTAAAEVLGANTLWLDFPEAIYRGDPALYQSEDALFGTVNAADLALDQQLADIFAKIAERAPLAAIYAPLAVGNHVDHQLVCSAADRLAQRKLNVKFYEDFPYITQPNALQSRQKALGIAMEPELVEISGLVPQKEEAIKAYASQVPHLFGTEDRLDASLREYAGTLRRQYPGIVIERYWRW